MILNLTDEILQYLRSDEFYLPTRSVRHASILLFYFQFEYSSANEVMDEMRRINGEPTSSDEEDHVRIFCLLFILISVFWIK